MENGKWWNENVPEYFPDAIFPMKYGVSLLSSCAGNKSCRGQHVDELTRRRAEDFAFAVNDADGTREYASVKFKATSCLLRTSLLTVISGRIETPTPTSTERLIVSMLSNSIT